LPPLVHVITDIPVELDNTYLSRGEDNGSEKWKQRKTLRLMVGNSQRI